MRVEKLKPIITDRLAVIHVGANLRAAASTLSKPGIGLLVICNENGKAVGVLSKSDLVRHLARPNSQSDSIDALMSRSIIAYTLEDEVHTVWQQMSTQRLQNAPILGVDLTPFGILNIGDVMKALIEQDQFQESLLFNYIAGLGYQ